MGQLDSLTLMGCKARLISEIDPSVLFFTMAIVVSERSRERERWKVRESFIAARRVMGNSIMALLPFVFARRASESERHVERIESGPAIKLASLRAARIWVRWKLYKVRNFQVKRASLAKSSQLRPARLEKLKNTT